jgi:hypothetical protein
MSTDPPDPTQPPDAQPPDAQPPDAQPPDAQPPAAAPTPTPPPPPPQPTIHEAEREPGSSGAILRGAELDLRAAVARRQAGDDVVVCGPDTDANRRLAYQVESTVGTASRPQAPHKRAGPMSLPHFHQRNRSPDGHTFYETDRRKTKRRP